MDIINQFINKYNIKYSKLNFDPELFNEVVEIIKGKIKESYDESILNTYAGLYYEYEFGNFELAEKYYYLSAKNCNVAMDNLRVLLGKQKKYKIAKKYFMEEIEKGNSHAMYNLAYIYNSQHKPELSEKYYLMAIDKGHSRSMNNLGTIYHKQNEYQLAEKYYLMAIKLNNKSAMKNIAHLYNDQDKYEKAEEYLKLFIEKYNCSNAMNNLGCVYYNQAKYELAEKYFNIAIENNSKTAMSHLKNMYEDYNPLKWYYELIKLNKNDLINKKLNDLKKKYEYEIICFENKQKFFSKIGECPICFETIKLIPKECTHYYCINCFLTIKKCAICQNF